MSSGMEAWIILFAIVTTLVVCIQLIALGGLFMVMRRVLSKAKEAEDKLRLNGVDPYEAAVRSYRLLERAEAATNQAIEATASAKELLAEVRAQVARMDATVSSFFGRAERTGNSIKRGVTEPVTECRAIGAGVKSALRVFSHRQSA